MLLRRQPRWANFANLQTWKKKYGSNISYDRKNDNGEKDKILVYEGPLASTYRKLKGFSLTSLGLTSGMTPLFFLIDTSLPLSAKTILAGTVLGTSGISTALIAWCGKPYVSRLWRSESGTALEMETTTLYLEKRFTKVYDWKTFLGESERPFAKWELVKEVEGRNEDGQFPEEETVAETRDKTGQIIGRWIVRWQKEEENTGVRKGVCFGEGRIVRHFSVHEELL